MTRQETIIVENMPSRILNRIEKQLLSEDAIKLQGIDDLGTSRRNPRNVLLDILNFNKKRHTVYVDRRKSGIPVWDGTQGVQCSMSRARSQGDLFRIMRHYRPSTTFKEFREILFGLINDRIISISYCTTINKRVIRKPRMNNRPYWHHPDISGVNTWVYGDNGHGSFIPCFDEFGYTIETSVIDKEYD